MKGRKPDAKRPKRGTGHRPQQGELAAVHPMPALPSAGGAAPAILAPPEHLPEKMHATWASVVELLDGQAGVHAADAIMIESIVRTYHRTIEAAAVVDRVGVAVNNDGKLAVNPLLRAERDETQLLLRLAEHYGLTVAARMRMGLMQLAGQTLAQALYADLED